MDAQWDMLWAMIGAALSLILLAALHDRQLGRLGSPRSSCHNQQARSHQ